MSGIVRFVVLGVVLAGCALFVYAITKSDVPDVPEVNGAVNVAGGGTQSATAPRVFTSSEQCAECHVEIYKEWKASYHGQAWTDPEYQLLRTQENSQDCIPCHAPKPASFTGIGNRFLARYDRRGEGVDCFTCHQTDKGMIGSIPDPQPAACRPVFDLAIRQMTLCYPCHNQHDTHKEWEESGFFKDGKDCNSCHMPTVERPVAKGGPVRKSGAHTWLGGHHPEYVRTAVSLDTSTLDEGAAVPEVFQGPFGVDEPHPLLLGVDREESVATTVTAPEDAPRVLLTVKNHGAGHNFPTDSRNNTVDLKVVVYNAEGVEVDRIFVDRFRNPYREEYKKNKTNTQIPSGAVRTYVVRLPIRNGAFESRLIYKSGPFLPDEDENCVVLYKDRGEF